MRAQGARKPASIALTGLRRADHIGDQMLVAGAALARHHHRLAHEGVLAKLCYDLARLDAVAADLHLVVVAAQKLKIAVRQIMPEVAGPVQPITLDKGTGDEPLGCQFRAFK
ncbi:hypothetical protein J2R78_001320 [Bradyrhizobium sp. USDA 4538]|nr:hypothetical protein [Bradyrhizobium sp. USDA 4538]MCP1898917.1 hypothetical protein [Bradyrhizobium sp. USDA 4537]MCP1909414.1 hypothetical protein [Bradyrhizobium elkanii]